MAKQLFRRGNVVKSRCCWQAGAYRKSRGASADRQTAAMQSGGFFCDRQRSFLPYHVIATNGKDDAVRAMADGNCNSIGRICETASADQSCGRHLYQPRLECAESARILSRIGMQDDGTAMTLCRLCGGGACNRLKQSRQIAVGERP